MWVCIHVGDEGGVGEALDEGAGEVVRGAVVIMAR